MHVPQIETERLILRGWRDSDLDDVAGWMEDPETMRFVGGVVDRHEAWRRIAVYLGHWSLRGYGPWALERREDGALLGRVGLWYPDGWPGIEVGWTLGRAAWGHGYATEAAKAACVWAWDTLGLEKLISVIDPDNTASIKVAERLGMSHRRDHLLHGTRRTLIYGIDRSDRAGSGRR